MEPLFSLLILGLVLALIYWVVSTFISGRPLQIVGVLFALILVVYALRAFGILGGGPLRL